MVDEKQSDPVETNTSGQNEPQDSGDYLRDHAAKWLIRIISRARQSPRFEHALAAITRCVTPEVRERGMDLAGILAAFACIEVSKRHGGGKKSLEKLWAFETGKTWKTLGEFPDRLRRMAKEIEQINVSPFFAPALYVNVKTIQAQLVRKRFEQLPGIINLYATGLEIHTARIPKQWAEAVPTSPSGPSWLLLLLSYTIKVVTGKWHDKEVAELLNAGAIALDVKAWGGVDALNVAQARSRWKKAKPPSLPGL